jgi:tRNA dimethylallyltransferase
MTGAGYREIVAFLEGRVTLEGAMEGIRVSHRKYARRQGTWFRHQLPTGILTLDPFDDREGMVDRVVTEWNRLKGMGTE